MVAGSRFTDPGPDRARGAAWQWCDVKISACSSYALSAIFGDSIAHSPDHHARGFLQNEYCHHQRQSGSINGGASKLAVLNARDLAERGHKIYFLCATTPVADELKHPQIQIVCSHQFELLTDPIRTRAPFSRAGGTSRGPHGQKTFATLDPSDTVVHLHLWGKALSSSVVRAAVQRQLPMVCTLHDFLLGMPPRASSHSSATKKFANCSP